MKCIDSTSQNECVSEEPECEVLYHEACLVHHPGGPGV